jgi:phosphatidylserine/phosphatidylglycerophosphate/cardiolipin synthase-like enzyme
MKADVKESQGQERAENASPAVFSGNRITPLLDGQAYFRALGEALGRVGDGESRKENQENFIYISGWLLNLVDPELPFELPTPDGPVPLVELLKQKARDGVDVRVLGWISWSLGIFGRLDVRYENLANIQTIQSLRREPSLANKCCLNLVGHPAGAVHAKVIVLGKPDWAVGFTGGIDLSADRSKRYWIDVQAQVEGPAVKGLYGLFRTMWNQVLEYRMDALPAGVGGKLAALPMNRPVFTTNGFVPRPLVLKTAHGQVKAVRSRTLPVKARSFDHSCPGDLRVQSLRTFPAFHYAEQALPELKVSPLEVAPAGLFEIRDALKEVIGGAERYFYAEDQYFWSVEAMGWLNQALKKHPHLKVILVTGNVQPPGPPLPEQMPIALREGLLPGLSRAELDRIAIFRRRGFVHAKTTLADDRWALIGSANLARRSFYTDVEHGIAVVEPDGAWVRDYRAALWGRHTRLVSHNYKILAGLEGALGLWDASWSSHPPPVRLPKHFTRVSLEDLPDPSVDPNYYDLIADPDARQPWYFPLSLGEPIR